MFQRKSLWMVLIVAAFFTMTSSGIAAGIEYERFPPKILGGCQNQQNCSWAWSTGGPEKDLAEFQYGAMVLPGNKWHAVIQRVANDVEVVFDWKNTEPMTTKLLNERFANPGFHFIPVSKTDNFFWKYESVNWKPALGSLKVTTNPPACSIRLLGIKPVFEQGIKLAPGKYKVEVSHPDHVRSVRVVEIMSDEVTVANFILEKRVVAKKAPAPAKVVVIEKSAAPLPPPQASVIKADPAPESCPNGNCGGRTFVLPLPRGN